MEAYTTALYVTSKSEQCMSDFFHSTVGIIFFLYPMQLSLRSRAVSLDTRVAKLFATRDVPIEFSLQLVTPDPWFITRLPLTLHIQNLAPKNATLRIHDRTCIQLMYDLGC